MRGLQSDRLTQFLESCDGVVPISTSLCCYFGFDGHTSVLLDKFMEVGDSVDQCMECCVSDCLQACNYCNRILCTRCGQFLECMDWRCSSAGGNCVDCADKPGITNPVRTCEDMWCESVSCNACRLSQCREGENDCVRCKGIVFCKLVEESETKQRKIDEQQAELDVNREQIQQMLAELQELRVSSEMQSEK